MLGIYNVNKPRGVSSNKIVLAIKKITNCKAGHFGTLDPLAQGVLPVAVGKATKLFDYLVDKRKKYTASFTFGATTETLDSEGEIIYVDGEIPDKEQIERSLEAFRGEIMQVPPQYSALSVGGVKAYKRARSGGETQLEARPVSVYSINLVGVDNSRENTYIFDIECGKGTYIRSLARDIAACCGTVGYMSALTRTQSGVFDIKNSVTVEEIADDYKKHLLAVNQVISLPILSLPDSFYDKLKNGIRPQAKQIERGHYLLYCNDTLFGIAKADGEKIVLECNLLDETV